MTAGDTSGGRPARFAMIRRARRVAGQLIFRRPARYRGNHRRRGSRG